MPNHVQNQTAGEKRYAIIAWLERYPDLSNAEIGSALKDTFGSGVEGRVLAEIRKGLGISKKSKKSITQADVIVMQKNGGMPDDVEEVATHLLDYMCGMGIKHFELHDDGCLKVKMLTELETVV